MKLNRSKNHFLRYGFNAKTKTGIMQKMELSNLIGPVTLEQWLDDIEDKENTGGWQTEEERNIWEDKMPIRMIQATRRKNNQELLSLVEEYLEVYQNRGYYDYGAEEELSEIMEQIINTK